MPTAAAQKSGMNGTIMERNIIGANLRRLRVSAGLNQTQFVGLLTEHGVELKACMLCKIEKQTRHVLDFELAAIAKTLNVPVSTLFG